MYRIISNQELENNIAINKLKDMEIWTISNENKKPLNINTLLEKNKIEYASKEKKSFKTLVELNKIEELKNTNRTLISNSKETSIIIVDVEPIASEETKNYFLDFPSNYTEYSKNGGLHLIIETPKKLITEDIKRIIDEKTLIKTKKKDIEYIFNNKYITLTKKEAKLYNKIKKENDIKKIDENKIKSLWKYLVNEAKKREEIECEYQEIDITNDKEIKIQTINIIKNSDFFQKIIKKYKDIKIEDYQNDKSSYEAGIASKVAKALIEKINDKNTIHNVLYQEINDMKNKIFLTYKITKEIVPYRKKHNEKRKGNLWLLYLATTAVNFVEQTREKYKK